MKTADRNATVDERARLSAEDDIENQLVPKRNLRKRVGESQSSDSTDDWAVAVAADIGDAKTIALAKRQEGQAAGV